MMDQALVRIQTLDDGTYASMEDLIRLLEYDMQSRGQSCVQGLAVAVERLRQMIQAEEVYKKKVQ